MSREPAKPPDLLPNAVSHFWIFGFGIKDYRLISSRINHQIKDYRREAAGINAGLRIIGRPLILRQGPTF